MPTLKLLKLVAKSIDIILFLVYTNIKIVNNQSKGIKKMYAYSYTVNYGKWSSNSSAMHPEKWRLFQTPEEAKEFGDKEANRLMTEGSGNVKNVEIEKFCTSCDGRGFNIVKTGKRVIRRKEVTCPDCRGCGTEIIITETYNA